MIFWGARDTALAGGLAAAREETKSLPMARRVVVWLLDLGGKFGLPRDEGSPYLLLAGIGAIFAAATSVTFACHHPFPKQARAYG